MSPVVYQDRVYVVNDNNEQSYLLALDSRTGEVVYKIDRDEKTNYSTPFVWENDLRTELVISGISYARSYDLDGKLLWQLKGKSILAIPTPFAKFGNLYLTSGHVVWGGNPMYAIKPGATGDISLGENQNVERLHRLVAREGGPLSSHAADRRRHAVHAVRPRPAGGLRCQDGRARFTAASGFPRAASDSPARPGPTAASCSA